MPADAYQLPEWELLLKAVVASPDDDLPRLVAADWLDEHGEPERAEFIRVQIERAKADSTELNWREKALWNNPFYGPLWAQEACPTIATLGFNSPTGDTLRDLWLVGSERVTFRRGFPFRVRCTAAEWLRFGSGIVPRQPVRELSLSVCHELEPAQWWEMTETLRPLARLEIDTASLLTATFIRDRICPGVPVFTPDGPVEDEIVSGRFSGSSMLEGRPARHSTRTSREEIPPPRNDTPN
jgi:uncharacterized protein (TIGR02996 family)